MQQQDSEEGMVSTASLIKEMVLFKPKSNAAIKFKPDGGLALKVKTLSQKQPSLLQPVPGHKRHRSTWKKWCSQRWFQWGKWQWWWRKRIMVTCMMRNDFMRAVAHYSTAIKLIPWLSNLLFQRAHAYVMAKMFTNALVDLKNVLKLNPRFTMAHVLMAHISIPVLGWTIMVGFLQSINMSRCSWVMWNLRQGLFRSSKWPRNCTNHNNKRKETMATRTPHKGSKLNKANHNHRQHSNRGEKTSKEKAPLVRALKFKLEQLGFTPKRREP